MIGVRADGRKELVALTDGYRESTESWADLLCDAARQHVHGGAGIARPRCDRRNAASSPNGTEHKLGDGIPRLGSRVRAGWLHSSWASTIRRARHAVRRVDPDALLRWTGYATVHPCTLGTSSVPGHETFPQVIEAKPSRLPGIST
jgi:hypothetical protein